MRLRPELEEIDRLAADARATAQATLEGMTAAQLSWTPGGSRWSAAMIADHLVRSNEAVIPKFEAALAKAPVAEGEGRISYKWYERFLIGAMQPGTKVRLPVPPSIEPTPPSDPKAAVAAFFTCHDSMTSLVKAADSRRVGDIRIVSPINSMVRFHLVPYLHALIEHERYHLEQVKALIEEPGFPR